MNATLEIKGPIGQAHRLLIGVELGAGDIVVQVKYESGDLLTFRMGRWSPIGGLTSSPHSRTSTKGNSRLGKGDLTSLSRSFAASDWART